MGQGGGEEVTGPPIPRTYVIFTGQYQPKKFNNKKNKQTSNQGSCIEKMEN